MPTSPFESSGSNEQSFPIEAIEISPYAQAIKEFDVAQRTLLDAFAQLAKYGLRPKHLNNVDVSAIKLVEKFSVCVGCVSDETTDRGALVATIVQLVIGAQEKQLSALTQMPKLKECEYNYPNRELLKQEIEEMYDEANSSTEVQSQITSLFAEAIEDDTRVSLDYLNTLDTHTTLRKIGHHTFDILKIAAGVAAGTIAARYIPR